MRPFTPLILLLESLLLDIIGVCVLVGVSRLGTRDSREGIPLDSVFND